MEFLPECYVCAMRQALQASRLVTDDPEFQYRCLEEAARILSEAPRGLTPPEMGEDIYGMINEMSGNPDPFREQKREQNQVVMDLLPWLRDTVKEADDPLLMAVRLSIAGNVVDPGAHASFDLEKTVMEAIESEAGLEEYGVFRDRLEKAQTVLFLADNSGEIVFDLVLLETIRSLYDVDVVVAVRDAPIINDVTVTEADEVGITEVSRVITSGSRMPGTRLSRTTEEFQRIFEEADLVVSKGQGNWETLEDSKREVFFLFQAKCEPVARMIGCEVGTPMITRRGSRTTAAQNS